MSREIAIAAFLALCVAEVLLRVAQMWEQIGRAVTLPCPCGGCAR